LTSVIRWPAENVSNYIKVITIIGDPRHNVLQMHESEAMEMTLDHDEMFGEIPDNFQLLLEVDGAGPQDLALGVTAARQVLESHGVDPRTAFRASQITGLMYNDLSESKPSLEDLKPWKEWCRLADIWDAATYAALQKATLNLKPGFVVCKFILDWPDRVDKLGTFYDFPYHNGANFGGVETYSDSLAGLQRFLKGS
jgi:hypothetical protein